LPPQSVLCPTNAPNRAVVEAPRMQSSAADGPDSTAFSRRSSTPPLSLLPQPPRGKTARLPRSRGRARPVSGPVEAGPGSCTFDGRHLYTQRVCGPGSVRAVSYNILADAYAQTEFSRTVLYPYCAPYALEIDYRQNLLKKELAGYSADLICLQEVDKSVFADSLTPALDAFGLEGLFRIKEKQHEGLATFYRRNKFRLLSGNIRLIQIAVAMSHIKHVACDLYPSIPVIFCGDFNSTPSSGAYNFISKRCSMSLSHPFKLLSACGEPAYTNYVGGFHGCLDYIFIDRNALEVEQVIPLPSHEEITTHQALPSVSHPSDHISGSGMVLLEVFKQGI
uniref:Phosphodiesterase 12 n=1 Tax=Zosterops lateralis melanops TaxID=1220523 RepID=A0A8D2PH56_ZOSLA